MEIRPVPSAPEYGVTREGRVFRINKSKWGRHVPFELTPAFGKRGYRTVNINKTTTPIHRLVAEAFIPNPLRKPEVAHNDGDKHNNHASNLRWATRKENNDDRFGHGTVLKGEQIAVSKLRKSDIPKIRRLLAGGLYQREIADMYGVSRRCIGKVKTGASWNHV